MFIFEKFNLLYFTMYIVYILCKVQCKTPQIYVFIYICVCVYICIYLGGPQYFLLIGMCNQDFTHSSSSELLFTKVPYDIMWWGSYVLTLVLLYVILKANKRYLHFKWKTIKIKMAQEP